MKSLQVIVLVVLAGCFGAHRENSNSGDDTGPVCGDVTCDDKPADACVDSDTLRTYAAACIDGACSYPSEDVECGGDGCCGDHCCTAVPSNASEFGALEDTGLVVAPPNGTFDTDAECVATSSLGACTPVTRADLPQACVCRADEITIGTLAVKGSRALVLLAKRKVVVQTLLDVSGDVAVQGPGAAFAYADAGGTSGGAGGSFATQGGASGSTAAAAGYGEPALVPLIGGMSGRAAGGKGGGGGGALQITAGERIEVAGVINAGGGGGQYGFSSYSVSGGGGGGSGGAVLVEAPVVVVGGTIVANGGGGGGGGGTDTSGYSGTGGGESGFPNPDPMSPAYGGSSDDGHGCPLYGYVYGGYGGVGGFGSMSAGSGGSSGYDSRCIGSAAFVGGGGGGGGVGRIRINTSSGCQCGGNIAPQATFGTLVKQ